jgi:large subunit ribosomal protein L4
MGIVSLDHNVFGNKPRLDLIQRVVVWQLAKKRAGTAKVKTRGEVRGGGKKPLPQKGTGRARQGSIRAPHFRGGGVVHGPRGNKDYSYTLPKKVRSLGLRAALTVKYSQGDLHIVDSLSMENHKTKSLLRLLELHQFKSVLFVDCGDFIDTNIALASQNLKDVDVLPTCGLNVYSVLKRDTLVLTIGAVKLLEQRLSII